MPSTRCWPRSLTRSWRRPTFEPARLCSRLALSGLSNVSFVEADAQTFPFAAGYDVAISRFGTMFFDDPVAAFTNMRNALRPGGRLCLATWQPLEANAWLVLPGAALLRWITLPDVSDGGPGMFAQSAPDAVSATLRDAGYTTIEVAPVKVALPLGRNAAEATDRLADTGVGRAALNALPDETRPAALTAVETALADHGDTDGVRLGAAILVTTATA
jgi:SAM-dependent methyltransferase